MGNQKLQTRFVVEVGGLQRKLLSVSEDTTGRLIVRTHAEGTLTYHGDRIVSILRSKHSIHATGQSETQACDIHQTTEFASGTISDQHLLTHAVRDHKLQPIYARQVLDLTDKAVLEPSEKNTIVNMGSFDPTRWILLYALWVTSPEGASSFPRDAKFQVCTKVFKRFALCVPFCFAHGVSGSTGKFSQYVTFKEEHLPPEAAALGHYSHVAGGARTDRARDVILQDFERLIFSEPTSWREFQSMQRPTLARGFPFLAKPEP